MRGIEVLAKTLGALLLVGFSSQADAKAVSQTLLAEHAIAQQGLGVGLASTTFWTQFVTQFYSGILGPNTCVAQSTGALHDGATDVLSRTGTTKGKGQTNFYFDSACKKPYIAGTYKYDNPNATFEANYSGLTGFALGKLKADVAGVEKGKAIGIQGIGTFTTASGTSANLGFACDLKDILGASDAARAKQPMRTMICSFAIAQKFSSLGQSLASVTTLKLRSRFSGAKQPFTFEGENSQTVTSSGKLTVTSPGPLKLALSGPQTAYGSAVPSGSSASFALFPPKPTLWSISDSAHDVAFAIAVTDNNTRGSKGAITQISTGKTLATFAVDQSGTGSIKYSDGSTAAITSWILSD